LLSAVDYAQSPIWLRVLPAVAILWRVWIQNYLWDGTQLHWREADNIPPAARFISSPYNFEAHYARKHTTQWGSDSMHLRATCEDDIPPVITHVETISDPVADGAAPPKTHAVQRRGLWPGTHIVDIGFLDGERLVESQAHDDVALLGPTRNISSSMGPSDTRFVRLARPVWAGRHPSRTARIPSSRWRARPRTVGAAI
jgi:transposase